MAVAVQAALSIQAFVNALKVLKRLKERLFFPPSLRCGSHIFFSMLSNPSINMFALILLHHASFVSNLKTGKGNVFIYTVS